ncbi:MAG: c-type cytochrome domain-containing protein [Bacteroidota bacterium]
MKLYVLLFLAVLIGSLSFVIAQENSKRKNKPVTFSKDVFPIIKKHCLPCHASDSENPSELFMDSYSDLMNGGKHGKPIVPKKGDESIIVQKLKPSPPFGDQMPLMTKQKLTDDEVGIFKEWIDQGAKKN